MMAIDGKDDKKPASQYQRKNGLLKRYVFDKFMQFVQGYEAILEKRFPRVFRVYQVFSVGTLEFYRDAKLYARISMDIRQGKSFRDLTSEEIDKYYSMPKEMIRVAPVLFISVLPFANYIIFPLAYMFPRQLLSSHFWSLQQKLDFALILHKQRLHRYRPVFRHLQLKVDSIAEDNLRKNCSAIFSKLGSGIHPKTQEILHIKQLFVDQPFGLKNLSFNHTMALCQMNGIAHWRLRCRKRLWVHAGILREMDLALEREGLNNSSLDDLKRYCFLRGLNPIGMHKEDIIVWLQDWCTISKNLDRHSLSLLLHCPIFLAYNHPNNWKLIH